LYLRSIPWNLILLLTCTIDQTTFADRYGVNEKKDFLSTLTKNLSNASSGWPSKVRTQALCAIRLCCRESVGTENISNAEFFSTLMELANLEPEKKQGPDTTEQQVEAAKCFVNLAMRDVPTIEKLFLEKKAIGKIIDLLRVSSFHFSSFYFTSCHSHFFSLESRLSKGFTFSLWSYRFHSCLEG
jgi:hypothetical protein